MTDIILAYPGLSAMALVGVLLALGDVFRSRKSMRVRRR